MIQHKRDLRLERFATFSPYSITQELKFFCNKNKIIKKINNGFS